MVKKPRTSPLFGHPDVKKVVNVGWNGNRVMYMTVKMDDGSQQTMWNIDGETAYKAKHERREY